MAGWPTWVTGEGLSRTTTPLGMPQPHPAWHKYVINGYLREELAKSILRFVKNHRFKL
jgi:hypothetical protein